MVFPELQQRSIVIVNVIMKQLLWDTTSYDKSFEEEKELIQQPYSNNISSNSSHHPNRQYQPSLWRRKGMDPSTISSSKTKATAITTSPSEDCCYRHDTKKNNNRKKSIIIASVLLFLLCYIGYCMLYSMLQPTSSLSSNYSSTCIKRRIEYEHNDPYIYITDTTNNNIDETDGRITTTQEYYAPSIRSADDDNYAYKIQQEGQQEVELLSTTTIRSTAISKSSTPNRTLVILLGSLRGGEATWEALYRNVLDINNADLALIIGRHRSSNANNSTTTRPKLIYPQNSTLYGRAKYIWEYYEENDSVSNFWSTAIDTMVSNDPILSNYPKAYQWRTTIMKQTLPHRGLFGGLRVKKRSWLRPFGNSKSNTTYHDLPGSGAIIFIFRIWLAQKIKQHQLQNKYYRFIITRSDHYFLCPHNLDDLLPPLPTISASSLSSSSSRSLSNTSNDKSTKKPAFIWTPNGKSDFGGITDRHVVVTNRYVLDVINILPALFKAIIHDNVVPWYRLLHWNPEEVIEYIWTQYFCYIHPEHWNTFPRTMFTVGIDGDTTRWKKYERAVNVSDLVAVESSLNARRSKINTNEQRTVRLKYATEYPEAKDNCARIIHS